LTAVTSRSEAGQPVEDLYPNLRGHLDLRFSEPDIAILAKCDLVFFATPNGVAMKTVPQLLDANVKIVDLAADFRLRDPLVWEKWYGMPHACVDVLKEAVYGLPEVNRESIANARIVANPGCYPTAVQLGFVPLLEQGLIDPAHLIADAKSGVSGAGRELKLGSMLCEASESFKAYGVAGHRHLPEIRQGLNLARGGEVGLTFVPHLVPMIRGIHATLYGRITAASVGDLQALYIERYRNEPFVDIMPPGSHPETRSVRGSNVCRIAIHRPQNGDTVVVLSAIDNLVKGAAGQAVQNMNIMCGLPETAGLEQVALMP
jgi:N-acetyl-gamma-glutamyl-phosphate reductase